MTVRANTACSRRRWAGLSGAAAERHDVSQTTPVSHDEDLVDAAVFSTEVEAMIAATSLQARGIQCIIVRQDPSGAAALTRVPVGLCLLVPAADLLEARELLQSAGRDEEGTRDAVERPQGSGPLVTSGLLEIRRRRRHVWLVFATFPLVASFATWAAPAATPYVLGLWMGAFAISATRAGNARCPRCGNRFFRRRGGHNLWTQRCLHCHLPLRDAAG